MADKRRQETGGRGWIGFQLVTSLPIALGAQGTHVTLCRFLCHSHCLACVTWSLHREDARRTVCVLSYSR